MFYTNPPGTTGYYRGSPNYGGQGSGQGGSGVSAKGFLTGASSNTGTTGWTPTILYLFVLIIAEMFVFGWVSRKI